MRSGPTGSARRVGPCDGSTHQGADTGVAFDDPRSAFDGAGRVVDINSTIINNRNGPEVWYTDPLGQNRSYSGQGVHSPN